MSIFNNNKKFEFLFDILICIFFASITWKFILEILSIPFFIDSLKASLGVVEGRPHWKIFQSRLLGPWTIFYFGKLIGDFGYAYSIFIFFGLTICNFLFLWALKPYSFNKFISLIVFNFLIIFFIDDRWLYSWDIYSIIFFILFLSLVIRNSKLWKFIILYFFMLINRESVYFLSLFIIIYPVVRILIRYSKTNFFKVYKGEIYQFLIGIFMLAGSIFFINKIREILLIEEIGPALFNLQNFEGQSQQIHFFNNLIYIMKSFLFNNAGKDFSLVLIYFMSFFIFIFGSFKLKTEAFITFAIINLGMLMAILIFAVFNETRVFFDIIPYLSFAIIFLISKKDLFN